MRKEGGFREHKEVGQQVQRKIEGRG